MALDLTTVTGVTLAVFRIIDRSTATWSAVMEPGAMSNLAFADYVFAADGSDVLTPGPYDLATALNLPGGGSTPGSAFYLLAIPQSRFRPGRMTDGRYEIPIGARSPFFLRLMIEPPPQFAGGLT